MIDDGRLRKGGGGVENGVSHSQLFSTPNLFSTSEELRKLFWKFVKDVIKTSRMSAVKGGRDGSEFI